MPSSIAARIRPSRLAAAPLPQVRIPRPKLAPPGAHASPEDVLTLNTYRPREPRPVSTDDWKRRRLTPADAGIAAAFFLIALLARWPFIQAGQTLLHSDEAIVGIMARDIAHGEKFPIYFYGQRYMGALESYLIAAISPVFDNPIHALRFGPACFLAALVGIQYLMLTRWFGRRGGLIGALTLICAAPMFVQWSVSARGGYIEILLWGAALLWAYSEWFIPPLPAHRRKLHRFCFGAILGSGLWINTSILMFLVPIIAHQLLHLPLNSLWRHTIAGRFFAVITRHAGRASLPLACAFAMLTLNFCWTVWVEPGKVNRLLLLGLVPKPIAAALIALAVGAVVWLLHRRTHVLRHARQVASNNGPMILGILAGAAPAALYVLQTVLGMHSMDPSLPIGVRPIWLLADPIIYLSQGLPLLFGADPAPFLQLVSIGRDTVIMPLDLVGRAALSAANWIVLSALLTALFILIHHHRAEIARLLRLQPANHGPAVFLMIGAASAIALYITGGCVIDFTTIRYLLPIWVFIPGLFAAAFVSRSHRLAAIAAPLIACAAWAIGQSAMRAQLGQPHPLDRVASTIRQHKITHAIAEPLDAHLLSYLTGGQARIAEFQSFWPRLAGYRSFIRPDQPVDYIVETRAADRLQDWYDAAYPGQAPPETKRFLWPALQKALADDPAVLVFREPLIDGYERIRLRAPLRERAAPGP